MYIIKIASITAYLINDSSMYFFKEASNRSYLSSNDGTEKGTGADADTGTFVSIGSSGDVAVSVAVPLKCLEIISSECATLYINGLAMDLLSIFYLYTLYNYF